MLRQGIPELDVRAEAVLELSRKLSAAAQIADAEAKADLKSVREASEAGRASIAEEGQRIKVNLTDDLDRYLLGSYLQDFGICLKRRIAAAHF